MKLLDKDGLTYYTGKIKNELTDYVKNTDYASSSKGGTTKINENDYGIGVNQNGFLFPTSISYTNYLTKSNYYDISKGTLENVITGKELVNKTYVDGLVGDIDTVLETLTVGGGVS